MSRSGAQGPTNWTNGTVAYVPINRVGGRVGKTHNGLLW